MPDGRGDDGGDNARISVLVHPGYGGGGNGGGNVGASSTTKPHLGRRFAFHLNKYVACVTDGLHLNYVIAKVFELPAAGCLLLINADLKAPLARLGMFDGAHYLSYKDATELSWLVKYWLFDPENKPTIMRIKRRAQQVVYRQHTVEHRTAALDALAAQSLG
jgi:spore maturation protein CgeB